MKIDIKELNPTFTLSDRVREMMKGEKTPNNDEYIFSSEYVDNLRIEWAIKFLKYVYLLLAFTFMCIMGDKFLNANDAVNQITLGILTAIFAYLSIKIVED